MTNNISQIPDAMPQDASTYDFQILQIAFRSIFPDACLWPLGHDDQEGYERQFQAARVRLERQVTNLLKWNRLYGLPSFVMNFPLPQQNPMGRLLPRYALNNPVHFIERLNIALEEIVRGFKDAYVMDIDSIFASLGASIFSR